MDARPEPVGMESEAPTCQVCGRTDARPYVSHAEGDFLRCPGCGLIFNTRPFDPDELLDEHYDAAEFFAKYEARRAHKVWDDGRRLDAILGYVSARDPQSLRRPAPSGWGDPAPDYLDIGCGLGSFLEAAEKRGLNGTGIDIGSYPVEYCCERGLQACVGLLTDTGFEDASFDLVTASNVLEHIPHTEEGLREVRRILRPGGIFVFIVPNGAHLKAHLLRRSHRNYHGLRARVHYTYHNPRTVAVLLRRTGFASLRYPWLITRRLSTPLGALGELAVFLPRSLGRQLCRLCRLQKDLFVIARAV